MLLAWHVDYWDYLGWKDPFGDKAFTQRQRRYSKALKMKQIGTPFFYVDNKFVRANKIRDGIDAGAKKASQFTIDARAGRKKTKITATARVRGGKEPPQGAAVLFVLYQKSAVTKCTAGECKGRTLAEFFVVRQASEHLALDKAMSKDGVTHVFTAPKGVEASNLGVAVLVEDPSRMVTFDCVTCAVAAPKPTTSGSR